MNKLLELLPALGDDAGGGFFRRVGFQGFENDVRDRGRRREVIAGRVESSFVRDVSDGVDLPVVPGERVGALDRAGLVFGPGVFDLPGFLGLDSVSGLVPAGRKKSR